MVWSRLKNFDKISEGLLERDYVQPKLDKCLFMKKYIICVIYVDDIILVEPDSVALEEVIKSLWITEEEELHTFELRDEGEIGDFLGIRIDKTGSKKFTLTQTRLIAKVLKESNMESFKNAKLPSAIVSLVIDADGEPFNESWDYDTVVGMLTYLSTNSRPDITHDINHCVRCTHNPKSSHAIGVKSILRYLRGGG